MLNAVFMITSVARKLWKFCISPTFWATDTNSKTALRLNRFENSKNIFSYINSIKNNFDRVKEALLNYVDTFTAAKTKIKESSYC